MIFIGGLIEEPLPVALGVYAPLLINYIVSRFRIGLLNFRRLHQVTTISMAFIALGLLPLLTPFGAILSPMIIGFGIFLRVIVTVTLAERDYRKILHL